MSVCVNGNCRNKFLVIISGYVKNNPKNVRVKKLYQQKMKEVAKKVNPITVTTLTTQVRGCPPLLLELNEKLIKFLQAIRQKVQL